MSDTYTAFAPIKYDQATVSRQGWGMANSGPDDTQLMVGFYKKSILNRARSKEEGTPVYESRDYVKIQHPGESLNVVDREVTEGDKQRWSQRWQQYVQGVTQIPDGIPISLLFPHRPEVETTLRGYNIHTVEQLAHLSAHGISAIGMGAQDWVNGAKKYLDRAEKGVDHHRFEAALAEKDQQIGTLRRQVEELSQLVKNRSVAAPDPKTYDFQEAQINRVHPSASETDAVLQPPAQFVQDLSGHAPVPKRRGRPPKQQEH